IVATAGNGRVALPTGEDGDATGADRVLDSVFVSGDAVSGETSVNDSKQLFANGRVGEREQHAFIDSAGRALSAGIELADGIDFIAKEFDAERAVGVGGIDVED